MRHKDSVWRGCQENCVTFFRVKTYYIPSFWPRLHHVTYCCINRFQQARRIGMPFQGGEKMPPVWAQRREELLSDCIVYPDVFNPMVDRLSEFVVPYRHALETEVSQSGDAMSRKTAWGLDDLVCHSSLKYVQYLRPCSPGRLSRCRFHNRPYNLHQGVHVTRRKKCVLFFSRSAIRGPHTAEERLP